MARDPRSGSAFSSGMRGREKPKIAETHGTTKVNDNAGGESKQAAGKTIGDPGGSAYSSGMRGGEQPKGTSHQVGTPDGHNDAAKGERKGVTDGHLQSTANDAKELGIPGNNTEQSAGGAKAPEFEEDGEHIYAKIPKASLKKRGGVNAG